MIPSNAVTPFGHVCAYFHDENEQYRTLLPYIKEGIDYGDKVVHIVNPKYRDEYRQRLHEGGIDVVAAETRGQLEVLSWTETYLAGGSFQQDAVLDLVDRILSDSRSHGYPRTRAIGDMDWFRENPMSIEDRTSGDRPVRGVTCAELLSYEARLNRVLSKYDNVSLICAYDLSRFSGVAIINAMRTHPAAFIGGVLQQNPFYVPPENVLDEIRERATA